MASAAAVLGIAMGRLRWAKRNGAPGFKGSRVYPDALLPWLAELEGKAGANLPEDKNGLECRRLRQRIEHEAWEFARARGGWILRAELDAFLIDLAERIKTVLRNKLRNELPPKLEGLRAPEIAARMEPIISDLIECLRAPPAALGHHD